MNNSDIRILVVDDEPNTCAYVAKLLARRGWLVETACDGKTALDMVERTRYDAAVLDYRMPDTNGAELCRDIDRRQPGIPKVLVTGYPTVDTVFPAVEAGVTRVLAKPVDEEELIAELEHHVL